jgi:hypothetical protein
MARRPLRPMEPEDIRRIAVVEELDISADGRVAVVARRTIVGGRYVSRLHAIPLDRNAIGAPRRLTDGVVRDGRPRIQPNGELLAFVRSEATDGEAPARIAIMPLAGAPSASSPTAGSTAASTTSPGRRMASGSPSRRPSIRHGSSSGGSRRSGSRSGAARSRGQLLSNRHLRVASSGSTGATTARATEIGGRICSSSTCVAARGRDGSPPETGA